MKILNLEEFKKLPKNIVFMKYKSVIFGELMVKQETSECDFYYECIATELAEYQEYMEKPDCHPYIEYLLEAEKCSDISIDLDLYRVMRDGLFEKDQLFAVYEQKDIDGLIKKLISCVGI